MDRTDISIKITSIENDLELLKNGHIHELEKVPGTPKCSTLANRMKHDLESIVSGYDSLLEKQADSADREQFDLLTGLLKRLSDEVATLSKKQPDALINAFKVGQINRVLIPLKEIMREEPSIEFLDILAEPDTEGKSDKSRNTYSDTALILSQFLAASAQHRANHYGTNWEDIRL